MSQLQGLLLLLAAVAPASGARAGEVPAPIIDMHLHRTSPDDFGGPQAVCTNRDPLQYPPIDPSEQATVQKASVCAHPLMSVRTDDENARRTAEIMSRYNIYGVLAMTNVTADNFDQSLAKAARWRSYAPGRYWIGAGFDNLPSPSVSRLEALVKEGKLQLFAEVGPQYNGETASAERLDRYFALAEKLDIPVGLHLGEGPPGGAAVVPGSKYSPAAGRPLDLEPMLERHPKLRLYIMHYGSPLVEETIALLYAHPNIYVDVAQNDWGFPRAHFYRQLQQLIDAGFEKRIMFGSDQMIWPDAIPIAIDTIEKAPFLTTAQKRDILYNNAARFLRLSEAERSRERSGR